MSFAVKHPTLASFFLAAVITAILGALLVYSMPPQF
jgi:hypothetical protein